jgi:putative peptide zinc metalloprotease protein
MDATQPRERRKQVRIQRRRDLVVTPQRSAGETHYVVKDPVRLSYFRLKEPEHFLFELLDGRHTLAEVREEFEKRYRPRRVSEAEVEAFARQLVSAGLAHSGSHESGQQLYERWRKRERGRPWNVLNNLLALRLPLFRPDRLLDRLLPWFGWLFTTGAALAAAVLVVSAVLLVATHFDVFRARLPNAAEFFTFATLIHLWIALGLVKVLHEFGHGLSCKKFGGEVHEMGVMLLCFAPCLYCNVSDAWMLPSKWRRIVIGLAGVYVELLIASVATFVWWHASPATFAHHLCLSLMMVCSVNTIIINGNPLLRYDGYHVLADWLEIPNLYDRARRVLQVWALEHLLGIETVAENGLSPRRRLLLACYAVVSGVYRWVVTFAVLSLLYFFLKPHRLQVLAGMLAGLTVVSLFVAPLVRFIRAGHSYGRIPAMSGRRLLVTVGVLAKLFCAFFLMPLPVAGIRQTALIELRPDAVASVFVTTPGILRTLRVRDGQHVEAGEVLAELQSLEVENQGLQLRAEQESAEVQVRALRELAAASRDPIEQARIASNAAQAAGEAAHAVSQIAILDQLRRRLQLCAPRAGVVMGLPRPDEIGKFWSHDAQTPFCRIGDPERSWALVPVTPADFRLLHDDLQQGDVTVKIRLRGRADAGWDGVVAQLPGSEAAEVPLALTQRAGGPLAARQGHSAQTAVPEGQHYLVAVGFQAPAGSVAPGSLAQVVFRCHWRSAAWWVWRGLSAALDLQLIG